MTPADIVAALVRTTLAASAAALAAWTLLVWLRIDSPRIHRIAWLLVIAQGWLFIPLTIEVETASPLPTRRAAGLVPAVIHEAEPIPFENEPQWGRGHFATGDSPIVNNPLSQKVPDPFSLAIAAWLLGATALVAISVYRYMQVLRTLPLGSPPDEPTWQAEWHAARAAAKLRRRQTIDLRVTTALGPLLHWAPWSYLILVPRTLWATLAAPERQAILRHELAHLRRGDLWKSLAIRALALPQWFNPLAWLALRRFDEAAEWACDDAAAATVDSRLTFAESLLQSAEYAVATFPASAPAARGVLTRRIHRLVSPRFKEESKMKLLIVPTLLAMIAVTQTVRIEQISAEEPPIAAAKATNTSTARLTGPPLSHQQMDFDRLAKDFENFARTDYIIEPPDVVSIRISTNLSKEERPKGPLSDVDLPRFKAAECMDQAPRHYVVGMDGRVRLTKITSVYIAGMTVKQAQDAVRSALEPQGLYVQVRLSIANFNSKVYYVITQGAAGSDQVMRLSIPFPVDGKENVAKALTRVCDSADGALKTEELTDASMKLVRPAPNGVSVENAYPILWDSAARAPTPLTNHGILPGDRIFVKSNQVGQPAKNALSKPLPAVPPAPVAPPSAYYSEANETLPSEYGDIADESYHLRPYDTLKLRVTRPHRPAHTLTWGDFEGEFTVNHEGEVELGQATGGGAVSVAGLTANEARDVIEQHLRKESSECELQLAISQHAAEKYVISIQRADGTELAVGALRPDYISKSDFLEWPHFRSFIAELTPISEVKLERADHHGQTEAINLTTIWDAIQAPQMPGNDHPVRPGDRLIVTVADDWQPRVFPSWLDPRDFQRKRGQTLFRIGEGWSQVGDVKFDHPDVQRPAPYFSR